MAEDPADGEHVAILRDGWQAECEVCSKAGAHHAGGEQGGEEENERDGDVARG